MGDSSTTVDISRLEMLMNIKNGRDVYNYAHSHGFLEAYRMKYDLSDENINDFVNDSLAKFEYCYFVSTIYTTDVSRFFGALVAHAEDNIDATRVVNMFQLSMNSIQKFITRINQLNTEISSIVLSEESPEKYDQYIKLQRDVLQETLPISDILLPMMRVIINNKIVVDGSNEVLESMQEFISAYDKLTLQGKDE